MNILSQEEIFIKFLIIGTIISMIFEFFRRLRFHFKTTDLVTFIQDIIFTLISGFIIIKNIIDLNNGKIRFYIILGIIFGILIYSLTLKKVYVIILDVLVKICKKILKFHYNFISKCLQMHKKKGFWVVCRII